MSYTKKHSHRHHSQKPNSSDRSGRSAGRREPHDRRENHDRIASGGAANRAPSVKNGGDFVMGRNCIEELLRHAPQRLRELYVAESRDDGGVGAGRKLGLVDACRDAGISVRQVTRRELDALVYSDSHQGVAARVSPRPLLEFDELKDLVKEQPFVRILALDGVVDPQNFGAILRAAECFGCDAVLWSKNRAAPLGAVVAKVSVGASELVPLCPVSNLHRALEDLKEAGAWIVGATVAPGAASLDSFEFPEKSVILMGSEGEGLQHLLEKNLDFRVYVPMLGVVSSLNVSQATTVMLHEASKQHRQKADVKVT